MHMYRFRVVTAIVCTIFLFSVVFIALANADWPMFHSDPAHDGVGTGARAVTYRTTPTIYIDNQTAENQGYTQDNNYYVWYTTSFSTHQISRALASWIHLVFC